MRQTKLSFLLFADEIRILNEVTFLEPYLVDNLKRVKKEDGRYRIRFTLDDLNDAVHAVAYGAKCFKTYREKVRYNCLRDKLLTYLRLAKDYQKLNKTA